MVLSYRRIPSNVPGGDVLTCHLNIDDLAESTGKQLKVLILNPNGEVVVRSTFDVSTKSLISHLALHNWKTAANIAFKHPEMRAHNLEAVRMALSTEFKDSSTKIAEMFRCNFDLESTNIARKGFSLTFSAVANAILKLHRRMSSFDKLAKSFAG